MIGNFPPGEDSLWKRVSHLLLLRSFRRRLSVSAIGLVTLAMIVTALYTFYRTSLVNAFLTERLSRSIQSETEKELTSIALRYALETDAFFQSISTSMATLSETMRLLFAQEASPAPVVLTQLPQGSWDNPDSDPGSIFIPARPTLSEPLLAEIGALKRMDPWTLSILRQQPDITAIYFGSITEAMLYYPNIDLAARLPADFRHIHRPWFASAHPSFNPERKVVWSTPYLDAAGHGWVITASVPVFDPKGQFRGVLGADVQLTRITDLISSIHLGQNGYAFLLDRDGRPIVMPEMGYADFGLTPPEVQERSALEPILDKVSLELFEILIKMTTFQSGMRVITLNGVEKLVVYQPIPSLGYSIGIVLPAAETQFELLTIEARLQEETRRMLLNLGLGMLGFLFLALLVTRGLIHLLTAPLDQITDFSHQLARGNLSMQVPPQITEEFQTLAQSFNTMAQRVRELVTSLEQRVAERTADLERTMQQSEKRAQQLQVISEVARAISTETELEKLLSLVSHVISERFGFYHVGVFLLDRASGYAVLRAANSPGGKRMLARGHKLPIGKVGIVGYVAGSGQGRIALDVGEDAVFFDNPDLPETRSEMALPLRVRQEIIGVLDVQSTEPSAFNQEDIKILSILADQVAIAIENARLLSEVRQALAESQALYGEMALRAWEQKTAHAPIGYWYSGGSGAPIFDTLDRQEIRTALESGRTVIWEESELGPIIAVPIRLQNQAIGVLEVRSPHPDRSWRQDEIAIVEAVAERLSLALENARLFEETYTRAAREQAVAEITTKIRSTNDPQAMIRIAIEELQRVLNVSRVEIIPHAVATHLPGRGSDGQQNE